MAVQEVFSDSWEQPHTMRQRIDTLMQMSFVEDHCDALPYIW